MLRRGPLLRLLLGCCSFVLISCGGDSGGGLSGPSSSDQDSDGIVDANDQCVSQPETVNHWKDDDGCPDTTDELYQFARNDIESYWQQQFTANHATYAHLQVFEGYQS